MKLILFLFSLLTPLLQSGQEIVNLQVSFKGKRFSSTVTVPSSFSHCTVDLYGSPIKRRVSRTLLSASQTGKGTAVYFRSPRRLRALSFKVRASTIYFRATAHCAEGSRSSPIKRLAIFKARSGASSRTVWFSHFKKRVQPLQIVLKEAFPNLKFTKPVFLTHAGNDSAYLYVVEQEGKIWKVSLANGEKNLFLDISDKVSTGSERGLLGLAFSPTFASDNFFFLNYTEKTHGDTIIARYTVEHNASDSALSSSEVVVLRVVQPYANHNGGCLQFGPDGYLYLGLGDGGSAGDPQGNGQNLTTLLGKLLRIDVHTLPYTIPVSNPFAGNTEGKKEEIYAYGLRNPWRFSFDKKTGTLWLADVGQGAMEEVNVIHSGKNYGWSIMEGSLCYPKGSNCTQEGLTFPVTEYSHAVGQSITGGYVYRGNRNPSLQGLYLYGDFVSGRIFGFSDAGGKKVVELATTSLNISSFGEDKEQELYVLSYSDGKVFTIEQ